MSVSQLKDVNQTLAETISSQVSDLVDSVRAATVDEVHAALAAEKKVLADGTSKLSEKLDASLKELESKQRRFFALSGFREIVFWTLPFLQIIETALLVWFLFFK